MADLGRDVPGRMTDFLRDIPSAVTDIGRDLSSRVTVRSTGFDYSFLGQVVIAVLIELGGIGIITVTTFLTLQFSGRTRTGETGTQVVDIERERRACAPLYGLRIGLDEALTVR